MRQRGRRELLSAGDADLVGSGAVRVVLASASPARLSVLRSAGLDPHVEISDVDEDALLAAIPDASPADKVTTLASAKATTVARRVADSHPDALVIGCDSMLLIDGELVGKPGDVATARTRWKAMAGRTGELVTGHAVLRMADGEIDRVAEGNAVTVVRFGEPTSRRANRSPSRVRSPSTGSAPGSSRASTATRPTSSGSASPWCADCSPGWV
jgi:predicted house-cleaning NTP pyrophosphatase (Maf/HAM1 superfamily)